MSEFKEALLEAEMKLTAQLDVLEGLFLELEGKKKNLADLLLLLSLLRKVKTRVGDLDSLIVSDVASLTKGDKEDFYEIANGGVATVNWSKPRRKWDHKLLSSRVAEKIIQNSIDPQTGVIDKPIHQMLEEMLEYVGISYWKVTTLRDAKIDPDKYCESGEANPSIQIHTKDRR